MSALDPDARALGKHSIRLISLQPATRFDGVAEISGSSTFTSKISRNVNINETIVCSIFHTNLDNHVTDYIALSYAWGTTESPRPILLDGVHVAVGTNLEHAFNHLREHDQPVTLWVDALCIDQQNDVEKSEQVPQMRQVYAKAEHVVSWLGPAGDDSDLAMAWIETYGARARELRLGSTPDLQLVQLLLPSSSQPHNETLEAFLNDLREQLMPDGADHTPIAIALDKLFGRPYWKRVWVVSEIATASEVVFQCGLRTVSEEHLHHAMRLVRNVMYSASLICSRMESPRFTSIHHAINIFKARRLGESLPLIYYLRTFREQLCSDKRDVIFGVLGMCVDANELNIIVDYRRSWQQIFTETTRALLDRGFFASLSFAGQSDDPILPSWVSEWTRPHSLNSLQQCAVRRHTSPLEINLQPAFHASGNLGPPNTIVVDNEETWNAPLRLSAISIATIENCGNVWQEGKESVWMNDLLSFATASDGLRRSDECFLEAVWRTAVADQDIRRARDKLRLSVAQVAEISDRLHHADISGLSRGTLLALDMGDYAHQLQMCAKGRMPILLSNGMLGLAPATTAVGDEVCILLGAPLPYVLRRSSLTNRYRLLGEAYVHGAMDGELAIEEQVREIYLV